MLASENASTYSPPIPLSSPQRVSHLRLLEAESIHILREVASEFERPVMLYSIGKDSSVMLRLAQKAFFPGPIPFPLLHIDTGFKFQEMLAFRDAMARAVGAELLVWRNEPAIAAGTNPIVLDTKRCCGLLKTQALLDAAMFTSQNPDKAAKSFQPYAPKAATLADLEAMARYHTHHHHPVGEVLKRELKGYADDLKTVSVFKPGTDTAKFAEKIYVDVFGV